MKKRRNKLPYIIALMLIAAAGVFRFALSGYSFISYILLASAGIVIIYEILNARSAHKLKKLLTLLLIVFVSLYAVTECFIIADAVPDNDKNADYLVVFGAGVYGTRPSLALKNRIDAAYSYLAENPDTVCIASGGRGAGEDISEAQCIFNCLTERGISPDRIILEDSSTSTEENVAFSMEIINADGKSSHTVAAASSEYHICRIKLMFKQYGMTASGVPGKTTLPVLKINYFLREAPAIWLSIMYGTMPTSSPF